MYIEAVNTLTLNPQPDPAPAPKVPSGQPRRGAWLRLPDNAIAPRTGAAIMLVVHATLSALLTYGVVVGAATWLTAIALPINLLMMWWRCWQLRDARRRSVSAAQSRADVEAWLAAEKQYHAEVNKPEPQPVGTWPARDFAAVCACPNCTEITVHAIREPVPTDPAGAYVIRRCAVCGQEWAER
ncbi:hypothetical protein [Mycolicibacterium canariasense]|nr:hypothetical protein [Mycolicibacterium canariasense]MCV7208370.1 hypothetical protein [Mycolicibacterium canariasense]ORV13554.1 hypothetical protein AWB94_04855 [Mycolicibacterium canariasense]